MIDITRFKAEYNEIIEKAKAIVAACPGWFGNEYDGIEIDGDLVEIKSYTYRCDEHLSHYLSLDDMNQPISFFTEMHENDMAEKERKIQESNAKKVLEREKKEKEELAKLFAKYGSPQG